MLPNDFHIIFMLILYLYIILYYITLYFYALYHNASSKYLQKYLSLKYFASSLRLSPGSTVTRPIPQSCILFADILIADNRTNRRYFQEKERRGRTSKRTKIRRTSVNQNGFEKGEKISRTRKKEGDIQFPGSWRQ